MHKDGDENDGEHVGVGFVEISDIFVMKADFVFGTVLF